MARISVNSSAINGAIQMVLLPNSSGIQKIAADFITTPLHRAMALDCIVLFVEYIYAVYITFSAIGINDRANISMDYERGYNACIEEILKT